MLAADHERTNVYTATLPPRALLNGGDVSNVGESLVIDDAWRDELVLHRDQSRCTSPRPRTQRNPEGRCKFTATVVVPVYGAHDYRAVSAWQSLCYSHHYAIQHPETHGDAITDDAGASADFPDPTAAHAA